MATGREGIVEEMPWTEFLGYFLGAKGWEQGEHVALIGPTGSGKSTVAGQILPRRRNVCVIGTKPKDDTLEKMVKRDGYKRIQKWPPKKNDEKVLLWPAVRRFADVNNQQRVILEALEEIYATGYWCVYFDEVRFIIDQLGLKREVIAMWLQGRSIKISVVAGTQRPAMVPLEIYNQSTHLFFWRDTDERNLKRISGISYHSSDTIRTVVSKLPKHAVLYVNTRTGEMIETKPERA